MWSCLKRAITTGCGTLDLLLDGGLLLGEVVLVYGEAETGKTTLAMQCAINAVRTGLKTLYVDSDGTLSPARLTQIAKSDWNEVASYIMVRRAGLKVPSESTYRVFNPILTAFVAHCIANVVFPVSASP